MMNGGDVLVGDAAHLDRVVHDGCRCHGFWGLGLEWTRDYDSDLGAGVGSSTLSRLIDFTGRDTGFVDCHIDDLQV